MSRDLRIGQGYDVHRLVAGRRLVLGGIEIEHDQGLEGHSDADVLLHAVADALLGAAGLGDIGEHFPPSDERWRGADSAELLATIVGRVAEAGYVVLQCDATVIAEAPRLGPYKERMRQRIAEIVGAPPDRVGVKATTHEGLGALGRGEGIAALAVALLGPAA